MFLCSGSEDNTLRIWRATGECLQVLEHPGCIWDATFLPSGDIASACSDAVARVWSSEDSRQVRSALRLQWRRVLEPAMCANDKGFYLAAVQILAVTR